MQEYIVCPWTGIVMPQSSYLLWFMQSWCYERLCWPIITLCRMKLTFSRCYCVNCSSDIVYHQLHFNLAFTFEVPCLFTFTRPIRIKQLSQQMASSHLPSSPTSVDPWCGVEMPPSDSMLVVPSTETRVLVELAESMMLHVRAILVLSGIILCTACLPFVSDTHLTAITAWIWTCLVLGRIVIPCVPI